MSSDLPTALALIATGVALALGVALGSHLTSHELPACHEDEVIVWSGPDRPDVNAHDTCVALDDMWWDHGTNTVHWFHDDERR